MHDNKLDSKSMSLEVLGWYGITMRGIQCVDALISRLICKTTNMLGQTGRCSLEFFTALANLSADYN
jgi:hypothetical protein